MQGRVRSTDPDKRSRRARLQARLAAACAAGRSRLRAERGSVLIEVMVGAVLLSIATVALLNGLDGAQATGAKNKARSVAAALAEQDLERMRSMPVTTLAGYASNRTVVVRNVNYTVQSNASWSVDTGGAISCSNVSKTSANIRIVSQVTSPATKGIVDAVSLVTPPPGTFGPGEGRAVVKVADRDGDPVQGATVDLAGTASYSGTTNSLGCAVFPFIPAGAYTATVSGLGLVDWQGNTPSKGTSVTAGTSTQTTFEADAAAEIRANFDTAVNGNVITSNVLSEWVTVSNGKLTVGSESFEASSGLPSTQVIAPSLFPFLDGYGVFAGQCSTNNPALAPTSNASYLQKYSPTPGQILTTVPTSSVRVRMPSINVRILKSDGTLVSSSPFATVFVKTADGCPTTFPSQTSNTSGALPQPGFPYGTYKVCAQRTVTGTTSHGHGDIRASGSYAPTNTHPDDTIPNTNPAGNPTSSSSNGAIQILLNQSGPCH
ncbi:MAG: hypothetical protein QOD71_1317 [Thermoleophilaceae bacterium]|jgi:Tfp pilus assembly protein PilV|nr:hypothetical protein [Thermoleophilaceae bacterium]